MIKVLDECDALGVEKIICAGDVVGYGPDPAEVISILRESGIPTVMGNHDAATVGISSTDCMIGSAKDGVLRARKTLKKEDLTWLRGLPFVYAEDGIAVAHSNFRHPESMGYIADHLQAQESFMRRPEQMLFIGHTHVEALFTFGFTSSNSRFPDCGQVKPRDFRMVDGWQYLINVGSVGYPRVQPYSSFVTFDSDAGMVQYHRVAFDFETYAESLRAKSIPVPPWVEI